MKALILAICVATISCGGAIETSNNSDAGPSGTLSGDTSSATPPEQQLSTSLLTWCTQICTKLVQCQAPGTDSTCGSECTKTVGNAFPGRGDTCAQFGLDFINCLNNASCTDLANTNEKVCDPTSTAASVACGSGATDAAAPGPNPTSTAVNCQSGSGMASAGSPPIGATVCQNTSSGCTDGHTYGVNCLNEGNNQLACTCFLDGSSEYAFTTTGTSCPNVQVVNSACGWQLNNI